MPKLAGDFTENAVRAYFSYMSKDPSTRIAKKTDGQGYYLRDETIPQLPVATPESFISKDTKAPTSRDEQPEEKFRALFMRNSELTPLQFPAKIEHTQATKKEAGINLWKFPDVVILGWGIGTQKYYEDEIKLDPNLLAVKTSLGEPLFSLQSVELKVSLSRSTFRENFFQCLSNSKWAHQTVLAIAMSVDDETLRDELERLGTSYDVTINSLGLSDGDLQSLPNAKVISEMSVADFEQKIATNIKLTRISIGKDRPSLDWETINDLKSLSNDFVNLFEWIANCVSEKKSFSFSNFVKIREIKKKS